MPDNKEKSYKSHIKLYTRDEQEKKAIENLADKEGLSASSWLRLLALKQMKKKS